MVVCLCRGLSDHAIRARLGAEGIAGARRLIEACGAGRDCGSCAWMLDALIDDHACDATDRRRASCPQLPEAAAQAL